MAKIVVPTHNRQNPELIKFAKFHLDRFCRKGTISLSPHRAQTENTVKPKCSSSLCLAGDRIKFSCTGSSEVGFPHRTEHLMQNPKIIFLKLKLADK